jgi:hypothetical protein
MEQNIKSFDIVRKLNKIENETPSLDDRSVQIAYWISQI